MIRSIGGGVTAGYVTQVGVLFPNRFALAFRKYALNAKTGAKLWEPPGRENVLACAVAKWGDVYRFRGRQCLRLRPKVKEDREQAGVASKRPGLEMLHPDFEPKAFEPVATLSDTKL